MTTNEFQINFNTNEIVIQKDNNQVVINSSLSNSETIRYLRQYINAQREEENSLDKIVQDVNTNDYGTCIYFLNSDEKTILTLDLKNRQLFKYDNSIANKGYINKINFNIFSKSNIETKWIKNLLDLTESSFTYDGNVSRNRYYKELLNDFPKILCYELLAKNGISIIKFRVNDYVKEIYKKFRNDEKIKLHEVFGITKYQLNLLKEKNLFDDSVISNMLNCFQGKSANYYEYVLENNYLSNTYYLNSYIQLLQNENIANNYNIKKLIDYINIDCLHQGLTRADDAIRYLIDYVNMNCDMQIKNFEKYPRYLSTYHDIIRMNYNINIDEIKNNKFKELIKQKSYLNYNQDKEYQIMIPNELNDIVREGSELNHCVASYIDNILEEKTFIVFLRNKVDPEKSLVTCEVKDNQINYARGQQNRECTKEEENFISKYNKHLKIKTIENYIGDPNIIVEEN